MSTKAIGYLAVAIAVAAMSFGGQNGLVIAFVGAIGFMSIIFID